MNICFVSYWGVDEGLFQATVLPHLEILAAMHEVDKLTLISMERHGAFSEVKIDGLVHHPIITTPSKRHKIFDSRRVSKAIAAIDDEDRIDLVMARGVLAAWMTWGEATKRKIPISIESFEPHADYMIEDGVWRANSLRYQLLKRAETTQMRKARFLLPVTKAYSDQLVADGVNAKCVMTMPCCASFERFKFDFDDRQDVRQRLNIAPNRIVGINTGKLGGIYLDREAIELMTDLRLKLGPEFFLLILSPDKEKWKEKLMNAGFSDDDFHIDFVPQSQVPTFLSAADFAFSLHRPGPAKKGISPIKNGEYMMNGLPIIIPEGIGNDSDVIHANKMGVRLSELNEISEKELNLLTQSLKQDRSNSAISKWAKANRSFDIVRTNYQKLLSAI